MAIFELVLQCELWGQLCQNRFHYYSPPVGPIVDGTDGLVSAFMDDLFPLIADVATGDASGPKWNLIRARSLYDDTDFHEEVLGDLPGTAPSAGQAVSPFVALSYRTERNRVGKNRGHKRFPGCGEADVSGSDFTSTDEAIALGAAMDGTLIDTGSGNVYQNRILFLDPDSDPPYQFYEEEIDQLNESFRPDSWTAVGMTTQRTRKAGVGI